MEVVSRVASAFVERVAAALPVRVVALPWTELPSGHLDRGHRALLQSSIKSSTGFRARTSLTALRFRQTLYLLVIVDSAFWAGQHQYLDLHVAFICTLVE